MVASLSLWVALSTVTFQHTESNANDRGSSLLSAGNTRVQICKCFNSLHSDFVVPRSAQSRQDTLAIHVQDGGLVSGFGTPERKNTFERGFTVWNGGRRDDSGVRNIALFSFPTS